MNKTKILFNVRFLNNLFGCNNIPSTHVKIINLSNKVVGYFFKNGLVYIKIFECTFSKTINTQFTQRRYNIAV